MSNTRTKGPTNKKLIIHIFRALCREIQSEGLALLDDGDNIISRCGNPPPNSPVFPFSSLRLMIGKDPAKITSSERNSINSASDLVSTLVQDIRDTDPSLRGIIPSPLLGQVRASHLIRSYLLLIKKYEGRFALVSDYETILNLSGRILQAESLDTVLELIIETLGHAVNAEGASLILSDPRTGELYFHTISGDSRNRLSKVKIPAGKGIAGSVVKSGTSELISDVTKDERFFDSIDHTTGQVTRNLMAAPIFSRQQITGVVEVVNSKSKNGFTAGDLEFLNLISRHIGLLIENARIKEDLYNSRINLDHRLVELSSLYEIIQDMEGCADSEEFRKRLLRSLLKHLKFEKGAILIPDSEKRNLMETYSLINRNGAIDPESTSFFYKNVHDIIVWMKENQEPYLFTGLSDRSAVSGLAKRFYEENPEMAESGPGLWVPIVEGDDLRYVISMINPLRMDSNQMVDLMFHSSVMRIASSMERQFAMQAPETPCNEGIAIPEPTRGSMQISTLEQIILFHVETEKDPDSYANILMECGARTVIKSSPTERNAIFELEGEDPGSRKAMDALEKIRKFIGEEDDVYCVLMAGAYVPANNENNEVELFENARLLTDSARKFKAHAVVTSLFLYELKEEPPVIRELEIFAAKDEKSSVILYEIVKEGDRFKKFKEQWDLALEEYRKSEFRKASILFSGLYDGLDQDTASRVYRDRCVELFMNPPGILWSPVLRWTQRPAKEDGDSIAHNTQDDSSERSNL